MNLVLFPVTRKRTKFFLLCCLSFLVAVVPSFDRIGIFEKPVGSEKARVLDSRLYPAGNEPVFDCQADLSAAPKLPEAVSLPVPIRTGSFDNDIFAFPFDDKQLSFSDYREQSLLKRPPLFTVPINTYAEAPPAVAILYPADGVGIPLDRTTEIRLQAYDPHGIDKVQVRLNKGPWQTLTDPTFFIFRPSTPEPVVIEARAWNKMGLPSQPDGFSRIQLMPYPSDQAKPVLALRRPLDGSYYYSGSVLDLEIEMRGLSQAVLNLDIGGRADGKGHPAPQVVKVSEITSQPFFFELPAPAVEVPVAAILRLEGGGLKASRIINIQPDNGIDEDLSLTLRPGHAILSGSQLWVTATRPSGMNDYSANSWVQVEDPTGSIVDEIMIDNGPQPVTIQKAGDSVTVKATLIDYAGHSKRTYRNLVKYPYLAEWTSTVYSPADDYSPAGDMVVVPGYGRGDLIWHVNHGKGGYSLYTMEGELLSRPEGSLSRLSFTGTGLVFQEDCKGVRTLFFLPLEKGNFGRIMMQPLLGELVGGSGHTLFVRHGLLYDAYQVAGEQFIPVVGRLIMGSPQMTAVDYDRLFILTKEGLYVFSVNTEQGPVLQQKFYLGLPGVDGFAVNGSRLITWKGQTFHQYTFSDESGLLQTKGSHRVGGAIRQARYDGEFLWLLTDGPYAEMNWQVYIDQECIALINSHTDQIRFSGNRIYARTVGEKPGRILSRQTCAVHEASFFEPVVSEVPQGLLIRHLSSSATLGGQSFAFYDEKKQLLPAQPVWIDHEPHFFLPHQQSVQGNIEVQRMDRSGYIDKRFLRRDEKPYGRLVDVSPADTALLAKGGFIPVNIALSPEARISRAEIDWLGARLTGTAGFGDRVYQWISLPEKEIDSRLAIYVNETNQALLDIRPADNPEGLETIQLAEPLPEQSFTQGHDLVIAYSASQNSGENFNYAEFCLIDTAKASKVLDRRLIDSPEGRITLRLPVMGEKTNLLLRARAYYGNNYFFTEAVRKLTLLPVSMQPALKISGVGSKIMAGSDLTIEILSPISPDLQAHTSIFAEPTRPIGFGGQRLNITVPEDVGRLFVEAHVSNKRGGISGISQKVDVVAPFRFIPLDRQLPFQAGLPDVGGAWFASGKGIYNIESQRQVLMESRIEALAYLGSRLLIALAGSGLAVMDPEEGWRLMSRYPLNGVVTALAVSGNRILAAVDGVIKAFVFTGEAIKEAGQVSHSGQLLEIQVRGDRFLVLTDTELAVVDKAFHTIGRQSGPFAAMAQTVTHILTVLEDGRFQVFNDDLAGQSFELALQADRLLVLQEYLLALSGSRPEGLIQVVDIRDPVQPMLIGTFPMRLGPDTSRAFMAGGRIWVGGSLGAIIELQPVKAPPALCYQSPQPKGNITSLAASAGICTAAAGDYGTIMLSQNQEGRWMEQVYPEAYTYTTQAVATGGRNRYLLQPFFQRVIALDKRNREKVVFAGSVFKHISATKEWIAAAAGSVLYLNTHHFDDSLMVDFATEITALAAAGEALLVSTINGSLYRLHMQNLPVSPTAPIPDPFLILKNPVHQMVSDGDSLYYFCESGDALHRRRLVPGAGDEVIDFGGPVTALVLSQGTLWAASDNNIYAIDKYQSWSGTVLPTITASGRVTALAAHGDRLFVGLGLKGLSVYQLSAENVKASATLYSPNEGSVFEPGESIPLRILSEYGVNTLSYQINGQREVLLTNPPFQVQVAQADYPPEASPLTLSVSVEDVWGEKHYSQARRIWLQKEGRSVNPFSLTLEVEGEYLPNPVQMNAAVHSSRLPIVQVEFFYSTNMDGPFDRIRCLDEPPYTFVGHLGAEANGHYVKARAIDIDGNTVQTSSIRIIRLKDDQPPIPMLTLQGPLNGDAPLHDRPFTVVAGVSDNQSGIEKVLLRRYHYVNDKLSSDMIVASSFGSDWIEYPEAGLGAGDKVQYQVLAQDRAGHIAKISKSYEVSADNPPTILPPKVDSPVREKGWFPVRVRGRDDRGLKQASVTWHGVTSTQVFSGDNKFEDYAFTITDQREKRIAGKIVEPLIVTLTDTVGQQSVSEMALEVLPDRPPSADELQLIYPSHAYYNEHFTISIDNIAPCDDGGFEGIEVSIVYVYPDGRQKIFSRKGVQSLEAEVMVPEKEVSGNELLFFVRLTDKLGQIDETPVQRVKLSRLPSKIQFVSNGQSDINSDHAAVGEAMPLQVRLLDASGLPLHGQKIRWSTTEGPDYRLVQLGTSVTGTNGFAFFDFDTNRPVGEYTVFATIDTNSAIAAKHQFELIYGEVEYLDVSYIPAVSAGDDFTLQLKAADSQGNPVSAELDSGVVIRIEDPGFHFGFADNTFIETLIGAAGRVGEQATVRLLGDHTDIHISAADRVGEYSARIGFEKTGDILIRYDHDNDPATPSRIVQEIPVTILPGAPAGVRFKQVAMTNDVFGDKSRLEDGETATIRLSLIDRYGNSVKTIKGDNDSLRRDAAFSIDVLFSRRLQGKKDDGHRYFLLSQGVHEFPVTGKAGDSITLSAVAIYPLPAAFDFGSGIMLNFQKKRPAITSVVFAQDLGGMNPPIHFTYSEAIENSGDDEPVRLLLDGREISGSTDVKAHLVSFTFDQPPELNRCYDYDTTESSWVGVLNKDPVLNQKGRICSPHIALLPPSPPYVLEESRQRLEVRLGAGIDPKTLTVGKVYVGRFAVPFSWETGEFTLPAFSPQGFSDGSIQMISLAGYHGDKDVTVANTVSIQVLLLGGDLDNDGLVNEFEVQSGSDPTRADSDGDGIPDGQEDFDKDGISNLDEVAQGTHLNNPDIIPPAVVSITPREGKTNLALMPEIEITFSEALDVDTVNEQTVQLLGPGRAVRGVLFSTHNGQAARWFPQEALRPAASYTLVLNSGIKDKAGNGLLPVRVGYTATDLKMISPSPRARLEAGQTLPLKVVGNNFFSVNLIEYFVGRSKIAVVESYPFEGIYQVPAPADIDDLNLSVRAAVTTGGENLALSAEVSASKETYGHVFLPERAIDGNDDGDLNHHSVAVIRGDPHAWWQADLGRICLIERIDVSLMTSCCQESNRFMVLFAAEPFEEIDFQAARLPEHYRNHAQRLYETTKEYDAGRVSLTGAFLGRYLRIVNLEGDYLALAEVAMLTPQGKVSLRGVNVRVLIP